MVTFWEIPLLASRKRLRLDTTSFTFGGECSRWESGELVLFGEVAVQAADFAPVLVDPVDASWRRRRCRLAPR